MNNGECSKTLEEKNALYEKHKKLIFKVLRDMHCNMKTQTQFEEYFDVAQMGLAKAINNISGDWWNAKSTYFYTYIKNEITNYFHYKSTLKRHLAGIELIDIDDCKIDAGINLEKDLLEKERDEELYMAIFSLKPLYREIIMDRFGMGGRRKKTIDEICDEEQISHQAVMQRQTYALRSLKKELIRRANEQKGKTVRLDFNEYF